VITMWLAVAALAIVNFTFKAAGPAILGDRRFTARTQAALDALPAALLAGLIVVDLLGPRWDDADWTVLPGLITVAVVRTRHAPHLICILAGVVVTATLRALV
jgi:uncharacterized membrane protein